MSGRMSRGTSDRGTSDRGTTEMPSGRPNDAQLAPLDLSNFLRRHGPSLVDFRRDLHRHPELSYQERATTDKLCNWLRANGLDPVVLASGTGSCATSGRVTARSWRCARTSTRWPWTT